MLTRTFFIHHIPTYNEVAILDNILTKLTEEGILLSNNSYCDVDNTGTYSVSYTVKVNDDTPETLTP